MTVNSRRTRFSTVLYLGLLAAAPPDDDVSAAEAPPPAASLSRITSARRMAPFSTVIGTNGTANSRVTSPQQVLVQRYAAAMIGTNGTTVIDRP